MSSNIRLPKICQQCGAEFIARTTVTQYCSTTCSRRAYKKRHREANLSNVANIVVQKMEFNQEQLKHKEFLSIEETCKLLGASRMTIYRQIKAGNIRVAKIGSRTIIKRTEIDKLFQI